MTGNLRGLVAALVCLTLASFATASDAQDRASGPTSAGAIVVPVAGLSAAKPYEAFLSALRHMESRGNYRAVNTLNFIGAYQFGEAAMIDLGYVRRDGDPYDNNFGGGFTGKHGIRSVRDFLDNPKVQDRAANAWMKLMWRYIEEDGLARHAGADIGGVTLSPSGMLAATHLLGTGALKQFIRSGGRANIRDPYGMPLTRYISQLGGYEVPFARGGRA